MKAAWLLAVAAACTRTSRDDIAGTWQGGGKLIHLRADGSYDARVTVDPRCDDDHAVRDACAKKQYWDRRGDDIRFFPAFVVSNRANGSFLGMFDTRPAGPPCECKVQEQPEVFRLRGDTMSNGSESAVRVVMPAWPVPAGWREEELAFPLDFAPSLAQHGVELIRFAPGFFEPSAPGFWSYAFAWWPEPGDRAYDAATIGPALATYFDGLVASVNRSTHHIAGTPPAARVELAAGRGTISIVDPFVTGAPVTLHARVRFVDCGARHAAIVDLSPTADREDLAAVAASFRCR